MIEHAFHHFLGSKIAAAETILIVNDFKSKTSIDEIFFTELIHYAAPTTLIDSLTPVTIDRFNHPIKTVRDYDIIILNAPSKETNKNLLQTFHVTNQKTLFITNNETADLIHGLTIIPFVHNMNIIYKAIENNYVMAHLPPIYLPYNFNMSIVRLNDNTDLLASRISLTKCVQSGITFMLRHNNTVRPVHCKHFLPSVDVSYEDPRLFNAHNKIYLQYVKIDNYISGVHTCLRQQIAEIYFDTSSDEVKVIKNHIPQYGLNKLTGPEKNWIFWPSTTNNQIICAYYPTKLLIFNDNFEVHEVLPEQKGLPEELKAHRGGSPGILHNNKIYCFTHTNRRPEGKLPEYNVGVIVYSTDAKPKILAYGFNIYDQNKNLDAFFYVCGAIFDESTKTWQLTGGINDTKSSILIVPEAAVESRLKWLNV